MLSLSKKIKTMKSQISMLLLMAVLASCHRNDIVYNTDNLNFRPVNFAGPIAKVHIPVNNESIRKLLELEDKDYQLVFDAADVLCLEFTYTQSIEWDDEIKIKDLRRTFSYNLGLDWLPDIDWPGEMTVNRKETFQTLMTVSEDKDSYATKGDLTDGMIHIFFIESSLVSFNIVVEIPKLKKNGESFKRVLTKESPDIIENLAGYHIEADGNQLTVIGDFTATATSIPTGNFDFGLEIYDMKYEYLEGYFGQVEQEVEDEIDIDFFKKMNIIGDFGLRGVVLKAEVNNTMGMPFLVETKEMNFITKNNSKTTPILTPPLTFIVPSATKGVDDSIMPVKLTPPHISSFSDVEFSNGDYPTAIAFKLHGTTNWNIPFGGIENFVKKSDNLADLDMKIIVPLDLKLMFNRKDTVKFDYKDLLRNDESLGKSIQDFYIKFSVDNNLPFDVQLETYAINAAGNIKVPIDLMAIKATRDPQLFEVSLEPATLDDFWRHEVKHIVLETTSATKDGAYQAVKRGAYLDISISANIKSE